jgi:Zn-dependent protease with chaperone function
MVTILSSSALVLLLIFFAAPTQQRSPALANGTSAPAFLSAYNGAGSLSIAAQSTQPTNPSTASTSDKKQEKVTAYTLPPDLYRKARHLAQIAFWGQIVLFLYSIVVLLVILKWRLARKYRAWAEEASSNRFLQAAIFSPLILLTIAILESPGDIGQHWVSRKFGLSVQGWGSWSWDWTKSQIIAVIIGIIVIWILFAAIRKSPRRWWLWFWIASLPLIVLATFLQPLVIDPLFHKFAPLAEKDPALTASLEQMVQRAGENIPPQRMFWMGASEKSTGLNAYVTGIGSSKRMVVWDTTIAKMTTPQIVFVAGHETGHYVLYHIPKGLALEAAVFLALFYLGYLSIGWVLARRGANWEIHGVGDWAAFPALLLLLTIFSFAANPLANAISRHYEHQADQYGLEVTHGLTPDSGEVAAQAFQILGEVDLSDPAPNPVDVFLFYDHPEIPARIRYSLAYDPWAHGGTGEFVH